MSTTKEKNGTFDKSIVISNLTLLVSAVISGAIPNAWLQIFFILCYTASVFFFLKGKEKNNAKKYSLFLAVAAAVILPTDCWLFGIDDSKKLSETKR